MLKKVKGKLKLRKKPTERYIKDINANNWERWFKGKRTILLDHAEDVRKERSESTDVDVDENDSSEHQFGYWKEVFLNRKVGLTKTLKPLSAETIKSNKRHIGDYYDWCLLNDTKSAIITNHIDNGFRWFREYYQQRLSGEYVNEKTKQPWSASTCAIGFRNVRGFYNFIADNGEIDFPYDILKKLKMPKATNNRDGFTEHEFREVMEWVVKNRNKPLWSKFILMMRLQFKTGMRIGELCGIRKNNIDVNEKSIKIIGKGDKSRKLYFQSDGDAQIWNDVLSKISDSPYLFFRTRVQAFPSLKNEDGSIVKKEIVRDKNKPTTESYYTQMFRRMRDEEGLNIRGKGIITSHSLRRYFITTFYKNNPNDALIQQIVGHSSRRMVEHYIGNMIQAGEKTTIDLPI